MRALHLGAALLLGSTALAAIAAPADDKLAGWEPRSAEASHVEDSWLAEKTAMPFGDATVYPAAYSEKGMEPELAYIDDPVTTVDSTDPLATDDAAGTGAPVDTIDTTTMQGEASAPVQTAALDLSPRPAAQNYPACDPGPGDDSCIQLYEPGVQTALASWSQPTGGFNDGAIQTAMGGPDDETELAAADTSVDPAPVETAYAEEPVPVETAYMDAPTNLLPGDTAEETTYQGVGGPLSETGYPPCSGAESDDRCIQLYEPGVTGEGN